MARVPYLQDNELEDPARGLVAGNPIALYRALANSPGGFEHYVGLGYWLRFEAKLDPRYREMIILAAAAAADCDYAFSHHVKIGRDFGMSDKDIAGVILAVRGEQSNLSAVEEKLVAAAREIAIDGKLASDTWSALSKHFDKELMVEIVLIVSYYACAVRVLESLEIDVEQDFQKYLEEFPRHG